ncbi:peptidylprolyl isomerase [Novosphingobium sp. YJ-S2-02]|uniref:peptidylprolyl isomerase n=1 Tax=Novosphingobium aureum TaxID=2792964 RepID=A0A931HA49_9SPHN|nr:peptidylprolyl isomerase [Novosphingobium aureum]MBH0111994.1 peptidylprolyl isomerase [Novosphingobium aureum]
MIARRPFLAPLAALATLASSGTVLAQDTTAPAARVEQPVAQATPAPDPVEYAYVALKTSEGTITLALDTTHAPLTSANFLKYVDTKRLDGAPFYRAMHLPGAEEPEGLLQGGIRDGAKLLPPVAHESTNQTGILHKTGTVSMARFEPGSATADFMILLSPMPSLDAQKGNDGKDPGAGFAAFGHVAAGMDVVEAIWAMPRSATKGEGVMKGDILENEVKIVSARRVSAPPMPEAPETPEPAPAPAN